MKITSDIIVSVGLVLALNLNIVLGGDAQITMNISTGLVGFIGKNIMDAVRTKTNESNCASNNQKSDDERVAMK